MASMFFIWAPGIWEIGLIFFAVLLLFGGKKIPELMSGLGKGIREFNAAKATIKEEIDKGISDEEEAKSK